MPKRIALIQGHPDKDPEHFGHALATEYAVGAQEGGHKTRRIVVADLNFSWLRNEQEWESGVTTDSIKRSQETIAWADHLVLFFPLWLGTMPALFKAFLEQVLRPGFAIDTSVDSNFPKRMLAGKSGRIIVTMGMPAPLYRWYFRAHSVKNLERNILNFCGVKPVRTSYIGLVGRADHRETWIQKVHDLAVDGA